MKIHVVLVRTEHSSNIGSTARAMANMGAERLILIDPKCTVDASARQMAAGAQEPLSNCVRYESWSDFFSHEGDGLRIALTRRSGRKRKVESLKVFLSELPPQPADHLYLIFGPEADGLDSDDLAFANACCHLPVYGEFASFNLAQAVLLALFMVRHQFPPDVRITQTTGESEPPVQPFYYPDELIKQWIEAMGFDVGARRASAYLTLRRLFIQNRPSAHELRVLEAILQQNIRKLKGGSLRLTPENLRNHLSDIPS
jgi:tRNA/rRNA methyltransferase